MKYFYSNSSRISTLLFLLFWVWYVVIYWSGLYELKDYISEITTIHALIYLHITWSASLVKRHTWSSIMRILVKYYVKYFFFTH